jgi:sulfur-carrier protein adenylyltransferase/sulfurtransferase
MSKVGFTAEELVRYSRQLVLPEVGIKGQQKLKQARVLIVGAGGLGSPIAFYLAAAGVGTIGIVDDDAVSISNLHRQILYRAEDIGRQKAAIARDRLAAINPAVDVVPYSQRLDSFNAIDVINKYDIVADCTDNFPTRYLLNDACVLTRKISVYGSVFRFEGQVSVFETPRGPCYRCLHPTPPPPELVQDCAQAGVLGVLPGIVGTLQANEILKLILTRGTALVGRLMMVDALTARVQEIAIAKDPDCPVCGTRPTIHSLIDYEAFCSDDREMPIQEEGKRDFEISVEELKRRMDNGERVALLDVREPHEHKICNLGGQLVPLRELEQKKSGLDARHELVVYCHHGIRSHAAVMMLKRSGFQHVKNLVGGIDAWARQIDTAMPRY